MQSVAASFIETIHTKSLTMDPDEFLARMVAAGVPDMQMQAPPEAISPRKSSVKALQQRVSRGEHLTDYESGQQQAWHAWWLLACQTCSCRRLLKPSLREKAL